MKNVLLSVLSLVLVLSSASMSLAADQTSSTPEAGEPQQKLTSAEIKQVIAEIEALRSEIKTQRTIRKTALWIGIPVSIFAALKTLEHVAFSMTPQGSDEEHGRLALKWLGVTVVGSVATGVVVYVTNDKVDELQERLAHVKARLGTAAEVLDALSRQD